VATIHVTTITQTNKKPGAKEIEDSSILEYGHPFLAIVMTANIQLKIEIPPQIYTKYLDHGFFSRRAVAMNKLNTPNAI
jgi:hypothetical protein